MSRKVVRKVLRTDETEFKYERSRQPQPKLGPWRDQLDGMLLANEAKSTRERLTLIRLFEDLRDLGYEGGYDTVRRYARTWAKERGSVTAQAYVPLYYAPGEAYQFDWSHEIVVLAGVTTTVKVAHVRLCHSRMMYVGMRREGLFREFVTFRNATMVCPSTRTPCNTPSCEASGKRPAMVG